MKSKISTLDPARGEFTSEVGIKYYTGHIPEENYDICILLSRVVNLLENKIDFAYFVEAILADYDIKIKNKSEGS